MALTQLAPPYPIFTDLDGMPLDNGYIYFGVENQNPETNPIQIFYDRGLTQPAAQPIRTYNGYIMRNGSPALVFANSQFSVTVRDSRNALVITSPVGYGFVPAPLAGDEALLYGGVEIVQFSDLATITAASVAVGGVVYERTLGQTFIRAANGATDSNYDYSGIGGVKWYGQGDVKKPLSILFIGQSNMRGVTAATGADLTIPDGVFTWNNNISPEGLVTGTQFVRMALGEFPANISTATEYALNLPVAISRELRAATDRQIYTFTVASGGHGIEAFIPADVRADNGWTIASGNTDLSPMLFDEGLIALDAVPNGTDRFDMIFFHQGERNMTQGDSTTEYRDKVSILVGTMVARGIAHATRTKVIFGGVADEDPRYADHKAAFNNILNRTVRQVRYADSVGLPLHTDNIHFSGTGVEGMARRMVDAAGVAAYENAGSDDNGALTVQVSDAETGGNVATANILSGSRWNRSGRTITLYLGITSINTTGLTPTAPLWITGLPFPAWPNQPAEGVCGVVNVQTSGGYITSTIGGGKSAIQLQRSINNASGYTLRVSDFTSGTAGLRCSITYITDH